LGSWKTLKDLERRGWFLFRSLNGCEWCFQICAPLKLEQAESCFFGAIFEGFKRRWWELKLHVFVIVGNVLPFYSLTLMIIIDHIIYKAISKHHRYCHEGYIQFYNVIDININHQLIIKHDMNLCYSFRCWNLWNH